MLYIDAWRKYILEWFRSWKFTAFHQPFCRSDARLSFAHIYSEIEANLRMCHEVVGLAKIVYFFQCQPFWALHSLYSASWALFTNMFFTNVFVVFLTLYYCGNERFRDLKFNLSNFSVKSKQSKKVNGCVLYKTAKNVTFSNQWHIVKSASKWMKLLANESLWHKLYKGKRKVGIYDNPTASNIHSVFN